MRFRLKRLKKCSLIFVIIFLVIGIFAFIEKQITPTVFTVAEAKAQIMVTEAISKAVKENITKNIQYKDLISIHKNSNGQVTLIQINTIEINRIETETTLEVIKTLKGATLGIIRLPLGIVTGSKMLSDKGPKISVALYPAGTVTVNTIEAFEQAGINQTRHRIILEITAGINIVQPMMKTDIKVKTDVPIAETIIVGDVPKAIIDMKKTN